MAWMCDITRDDDKPDVGGITAIWDAGLPTEFRYHERLQIIAGSRAQFVTRAKAALVAYQTRTAWEAGAETALAAALNAP